jgi:hypothetical protein
MSFQLGVPLNDETLSRMSEKERNFWMEFFDEAQLAIENMKMDGKNGSYLIQAPPTLVGKYKKAITQYNGRIYCQTKQLEHIFKF